MNALRSMLFIAALAGLAVGVAMTLLQYVATVPLILQAEAFEALAPKRSTTRCRRAISLLCCAASLASRRSSSERAARYWL